MNRLLSLAAALIYLSLALSPVMSYAQPRTPAPNDHRLQDTDLRLL